MANTYSQIYLQIIFSVQNRECLLPSKRKEELHQYITGLVKRKDCKMIAVNSVADHIHIFIGLKPSCNISDLVKDIKLATSKLIKQERLIKTNFYWQDSYGVFSYSRSQIDQVCKYISLQEENQKKQTFKEEYLEFLKKFKVDYDEKYISDL